MSMNNLGMAMEKLAIIRWINVPFQAIISLFIMIIQIPNITEGFYNCIRDFICFHKFLYSFTLHAVPTESMEFREKFRKSIN